MVAAEVVHGIAVEVADMEPELAAVVVGVLVLADLSLQVGAVCLCPLNPSTTELGRQRMLAEVAVAEAV